MYLHYTVHFHSTFYHKDQSSVSKKAAWEEDLREKWNGDLWGQYWSCQKYVNVIYLNYTIRQDGTYSLVDSDEK